MEKLTLYRAIARFVKKAIALSMPKERSTFPCQKSDRPFHIAKNSQKAITLPIPQKSDHAPHPSKAIAIPKNTYLLN